MGYIRKFTTSFKAIGEFFIHAVAEKDSLDRPTDAYPYRLSLGRSSWIVWFYTTIIFVLKAIPLSYMWFLIGLSLLGYIIGKQFIVTSIGGASRSEYIDFTNEEHP